MTKKSTVTLLSLAAFIISVSIVFSSSCKRNKECDAVVNVVDDSSGNPIAGATVHIYPPPTSSNLAIQDQTQATDGSGSVTFHFKLPAILQADVTNIGRGAGTGLVKLEEGKQVSKTVKCY